ncbi:hypothetical protein OZX73_03095 [Bifidobacterium sp. ESL0775]|uniref:hypothetical protein n=1 Tax=Bifidobacterium sp. ESL0775 TaxID=2983230 RepID=UPI0023F6A90B|nr:hypothetical protein [Bifidobacterium sp. ESL0775]WEV69864.1 hypothetical protein OZX73_03095 [Bifidobacterium sp. ESL0775]
MAQRSSSDIMDESEERSSASKPTTRKTSGNSGKRRGSGKRHASGTGNGGGPGRGGKAGKRSPRRAPIGTHRCPPAGLREENPASGPSDRRCIPSDLDGCFAAVADEAWTQQDDDELEALARRLQHRKMEEGIAKANRDWLDAPFDEWNGNLESHVHHMSEEHAAELCVAMADMLSARDALIMSLVGGARTVVDTKAMLDLASSPHDPANVIRLYRLLDRAFNDADCSPDPERCACGIDMLDGMASQVCGRFEVQPLTVAAYGSWWLGSDDALDYATRALEVDGQCTLARIICSALAQGLRPAWRLKC